MTDAQRLAFVKAVHHGEHPLAELRALGVSAEEFVEDCCADQDFCAEAFTVILEHAIVCGVEQFSAELEEFTTD